MRAAPSSAEILQVVAHFLKETVAPQLGEADRFYALVAANGVQTVRREIELGGVADAAALNRLRALLESPDGELATLNETLSARIADGTLPMHDPGLCAHLVATALDEAAIDQPRHPTIERMRAAVASPPTEG
ncbi:DUF6285 domain-containing protein [Novosphingopyxis sp.]|uniref:DUF6285 domain-containing protein n=1 Tax=Novosphingopyxis sp. TaxID=2709690 RepID=UPI003B5C6FBA